MQNKLKKILAKFLLSIVAISSVYAAEFQGNVEMFYINKNNLALLNLKQGTTANRPGCVRTGGWDFSFDPISEYGKQWVSMLLAARMAEKDIRVGYTANETGRCDITYVYFNKP